MTDDEPSVSPRATRPGPEPERTRRKREQIRAGALSVFLDAGFVGTTMDQVAASAGVSKQTLYAYYRSKEDLLVDVLSTQVSILDDEGSTLWDRQVSDVDELRRALVDVLEQFTVVAMRDRYLALIRVVISELPAVPALADLWRRAVPAKGMERMKRLLRRAHRAGVLRDVDLDLATRMLVGPVITFVILDGLARPGHVVVPERAQLESLVELYLRAVT